MINTATLTKLVDPGIRKHFVDAYNEVKFDIGKLYDIGKQESKTDEYSNTTGINQLSPVAEGAEYNEDTPIESYGVSLTSGKYGKTISVTDEMIRYGKTKKAFDASAMGGKAARRTIQKYASSQINNGFSTSYTSMTDAKPKFSTLHPRADGGATQSNASSTGLVLSDTNLEVGILAMENFLDDRGELIECMPDQLIVPNALRKTAARILGSNLQSGTTDNDTNVYKTMTELYGGTMQLLVWDYLGSTAGGSDTAWFLRDKDIVGNMWQWEEKPNVGRNNEIGFKSDKVFYKIRTYFSLGWRDWRDMWGSEGAGSAYSS